MLTSHNHHGTGTYCMQPALYSWPVTSVGSSIEVLVHRYLSRIDDTSTLYAVSVRGLIIAARVLGSQDGGL